MEGLQWRRILFEDSFRRGELMPEERQVYDQGKRRFRNVGDVLGIGMRECRRFESKGDGNGEGVVGDFEEEMVFYKVKFV